MANLNADLGMCVWMVIKFCCF